MPSSSGSQRRLFGVALALKRGELKHASPEARRLAESMSEEKLAEFAHGPVLEKSRGRAWYEHDAAKRFSPPYRPIKWEQETPTMVQGYADHGTYSIFGNRRAPRDPSRKMMYFPKKSLGLERLGRYPDATKAMKAAALHDKAVRSKADLSKSLVLEVLPIERTFLLLEVGEDGELRKGLTPGVTERLCGSAIFHGINPPEWLSKSLGAGTKRIWVKAHSRLVGGKLHRVDPHWREVQIEGAPVSISREGAGVMRVKLHPELVSSGVRESVRTKVPHKLEGEDLLVPEGQIGALRSAVMENVSTASPGEDYMNRHGERYRKPEESPEYSMQVTGKKGSVSRVTTTGRVTVRDLDAGHLLINIPEDVEARTKLGALIARAIRKDARAKGAAHKELKESSGLSGKLSRIAELEGGDSPSSKDKNELLRLRAEVTGIRGQLAPLREEADAAVSAVKRREGGLLIDQQYEDLAHEIIAGVVGDTSPRHTESQAAIHSQFSEDLERSAPVEEGEGGKRRRFAEGEQIEHFHRFWERDLAQIRRTAYSLAGARYGPEAYDERAEDLLQETWLQASESFHQFTDNRNITSFGAWVYRAMRNKWIDIKRKEMRGERVIEVREEDDDEQRIVLADYERVMGEQLSTEFDAMAKVMADQLDDQYLVARIADLPENVRLPIHLAYVEAFSPEQVAYAMMTSGDVPKKDDLERVRRLLVGGRMRLMRGMEPWLQEHMPGAFSKWQEHKKHQELSAQYRAEKRGEGLTPEQREAAKYEGLAAQNYIQDLKDVRAALVARKADLSRAEDTLAKKREQRDAIKLEIKGLKEERLKILMASGGVGGERRVKRLDGEIADAEKELIAMQILLQGVAGQQGMEKTVEKKRAYVRKDEERIAILSPYAEAQAKMGIVAGIVPKRRAGKPYGVKRAVVARRTQANA